MLRENPCEFCDEYRIGVEIIDREHQRLFELVEKANRMARGWSADSGFDEIRQILQELKDYTEFHFADEESYMRNIRYEGYEAQKRAHEAFISRLEETDLEQVQENPREYLLSLVEYLLGWLIHHILHADKKIPAKEKIGNQGG